MDRKNFAFTLNSKRYEMENGQLVIDGVLSDPEYIEYELAIFVAELLEEKTMLRCELGILQHKEKKEEKYKPQFMDPPGMVGPEMEDM